MRTQVQVEGIAEIELFIALLSLGVSSAIREGRLSTNLAERILYRPYVMTKLRNLGASEELVDLIHAGTELDDIQRLVPHAAPQALDELFNAALQLIQQKSNMPEQEINGLRFTPAG